MYLLTSRLRASGRRPEAVGPKVSKLEKLPISLPKFSGKKLVCQVLHLDVFGNVIMNVGEKVVRKIPVKFGEGVEIRSGGRKLQAHCARSYYEVGKGAMAVLLGSQGFLEVAVREVSARD